MSKIIFSVLILTVLSSSLCNFMQAEDQKINPEDFLTFLRGANSGFGFFTGLPYESDCKTIDPKTVDLAREIFNDIKTIKITNGVNVIRRNIPKALKIIDLITNQGGSCKNWGQELRKMADKMINRVNQSNYPKEAIFHAMTNMAPITDMTVTSIKHFMEKDYSNSGRMGGELMRFIFFWVL